MPELLTFDEVMERANKPHLLLGNGFSMAYDRQRFSFTSLLQSAVDNSIIQKESPIYKVFEKLATADFESVMRLLDESEQVLEVYGADPGLRKELRSDASLLKGYLVKIITNNHPEKSTVVTSEEKGACLAFLNKFGDERQHIYTLNYDLLLYWATMHQGQDIFTDGFGNTEDSEDEAFVVYQNSKFGFKVHYLHGGLHLFDADGEIIKKTYNNSEINLIQQTAESLERDEYPIFISEGVSKQKMAKILHNGYLNHCYRSLKASGRDLVIFGTTLKKSDEHILDAVVNSEVENVFIGVSAMDSVPHIEAAINSWNTEAMELNKEKKPKSKKKIKKIHLYDYRTVDVWGKDGL
ncbi:MAG: DUF4917 family protein [Patescibacteria group bacterium]|jgi:hypothetical protein